jgi:TPR repeat protein
MGMMIRDGLGVPADAGVGLDWMRKAADAGYGQAYLDLGAAYVNGIDTIGDRLAPFNSRRIDPEMTFGCEYQFA